MLKKYFFIIAIIFSVITASSMLYADSLCMISITNASVDGGLDISLVSGSKYISNNCGYLDYNHTCEIGMIPNTKATLDIFINDHKNTITDAESYVYVDCLNSASDDSTSSAHNKATLTYSISTTPTRHYQAKCVPGSNITIKGYACTVGIPYDLG